MNKKTVDVVLIILVLGGAFLNGWLFFSKNFEKFIRSFESSEPSVSEEEESFLLRGMLGGTLDLAEQVAVLKVEGVKDNFIVTKVLSVNKDSQSVNLEIGMPGAGSLPLTTWEALVTCPATSTYLVGDNLDVWGERVDFFDNVKPKDNLWGYCTNSDCSELGKECILHRR